MSEYESGPPVPFESKRVPFERTVILKFERFSANISMGGMFIRTERFQKPGSVFEFVFKLADDSNLIQGLGEVVWVREDDLGPEAPPGLGIRFLELDWESRKLISRVIGQYIQEGGVPFDVDRGSGVPPTERSEAQEQELLEALNIEPGSETEAEVAPAGSVGAAAPALGERATVTGAAEPATEEWPGLKTTSEEPVGAEELAEGATLDEPLEAALDELAAEPSLPDMNSLEAAPQSFEVLLAEPVGLESISDDLDLPWEMEEAAEVARVAPAEPTYVEAPTPEPHSPYSDFGTEGMAAPSTGAKRSSTMRSVVPLLLLAVALVLFLTRNSWLPQGGDPGGDSRSESAEIDLGATTTTTPTSGGLVTEAEDGGDASDEVNVAEGEGESGGVATAPELGAPTDVADAGPRDSSEAVDTAGETGVIDDSGVAAPGRAAGDVEASLRLARGAVRAWAAAWANQDPETYLEFYSRDFQPAGGLSREAWEAQRWERLTAPRSIEVELSEMDVSLGDNDRMNASFVQEYRSDRHSDVVNKNLDLVLEDGQWKIVKEWSTN
jgi:uncharacterized protein (TIGR02266 family)